jgi:hypothetical protein
MLVPGMVPRKPSLGDRLMRRSRSHEYRLGNSREIDDIFSKFPTVSCQNAKVRLYAGGARKFPASSDHDLHGSYIMGCVCFDGLADSRKNVLLGER